MIPPGFHGRFTLLTVMFQSCNVLCHLTWAATKAIWTENDFCLLNWFKFMEISSDGMYIKLMFNWKEMRIILHAIKQFWQLWWFVSCLTWKYRGFKEMSTQIKTSKKRDISSCQRIAFDWQIYTRLQVLVIFTFLLMFIEIALSACFRAFSWSFSQLLIRYAWHHVGLSPDWLVKNDPD